MICGNESIRLNSEENENIMRLINDGKYHSLQEYKDIISQLTIRKSSRNYVNKSPPRPPKSSKSPNVKLEEDINKVLMKLNDFINNNPYSPETKQIKRQMQEANSQIIPTVRFAQLEQILINLEQESNNDNRRNKQNDLYSSMVERNKTEKEIPVINLSHSSFAMSASLLKKRELEKQMYN